jgi:hypothetical protein
MSLLSAIDAVNVQTEAYDEKVENGNKDSI